MQILPHDVDHEFPEFKNLIQEMRDRDQRLAELIDQYEQVNAQIVDIEENDKPFQDFEFEVMKKRRLKLKDEIYFLLPLQRNPDPAGGMRRPLFTNEQLAGFRDELARRFRFRPEMVRVCGEWRNDAGKLIPDHSPHLPHRLRSHRPPD